MNKHWDLVKLYRDFKDDNFKQDREKTSRLLESLEKWEPSISDSDTETAEIFIKRLIDFYQVYRKMIAFSHLTVSVDARNVEGLKTIEDLEREAARLTGPRVRFQKWLGEIVDLESLVNSSPLLQEHRFFLRELVNNSHYLLSEKEETVIADLKRTGSSAWTRLQQKLTSTLMVDVSLEGEVKKLPLPEVRNLAFKSSPQVRRNGYEAELKAYERIEEPVAASLNGIKGEVITLAGKRGYENPLEETLLKSRMSQKTLETMLGAMRDFMPNFRQYYKTKARLLNQGDALPFYDIFAPMGDVEMEFTLEKARDFIINNISSFSPEMAELYQQAFSENWIDSEPRDGKRGGAFCFNIHPIGESRILCNFTGSFNDMTTLAHELGHAYHGHCLTEESIINASYPMPLAETASIFSETIVTNAARKEADPEQAFAILENKISQAGQVIVDIYSRFIFENNLFAKRKQASLSVGELKDMMISAQQEAYGEALNHNYLHPYAWLNKPHYYLAENNYYNFPYAFGLLFGLGVYALYLEQGRGFSADYIKLLKTTGKNEVDQVAEMIGIKLDSPEFWNNSLAVIKKDIADFQELAMNRLG